MLLSRDTVNFQLTYLATAFRRKLDQRVVDVYHRECGRTMSDEQFAAAIAMVLDEEEAKWPSIGHLKALVRGRGHREHGVPHLKDCGPLSECLSDIDRGTAYGGDDQFRGRPGVTPMIERLVYEDAAVTAGSIPGEGLTDRLRRIVQKAEAEIGRLMAAAQPPAPPAERPEPQMELGITNDPPAPEIAT